MVRLESCLVHRASPRKTTLRERKHYEEENWETETDEVRREDDLSKLKGVRSKSASRYQVGTNLVPLSPDVAKYFPHEQSVNLALRKLIHVTKAKIP